MRLLMIFLLCLYSVYLAAQQPVPVKPRVLVSTDIGGTDPDDNQSMAHLLMYSDKFIIEGLVSSPSYGKGTREEILRMIDLYEKDLPQLKQHQSGLATPDSLRAITKQGRQGNAPYAGYSTATEGSDWIIKCAKRKSSQPLWILVWGGLEDLAQALHDAPEIEKNIKESLWLITGGQASAMQLITGWAPIGTPTKQILQCMMERYREEKPFRSGDRMC